MVGAFNLHDACMSTIQPEHSTALDVYAMFLSECTEAYHPLGPKMKFLQYYTEVPQCASHLAMLLLNG